LPEIPSLNGLIAIIFAFLQYPRQGYRIVGDGALPIRAEDLIFGDMRAGRLRRA
jgi:hypothetical protein